MSERRFDEEKLRRSLATLSSEQRVAFAAACAQRLLPAYQSYQRTRDNIAAKHVAEALDLVWQDLAGKPISASELRGQIDWCMANIPREDAEAWVPEQAAAEDAVAALAYALRCRQGGEPQEAAWAARRVYEALDHFVTSRDDVDVNVSGTEDHVRADPLIQAELERQERDLLELQSNPTETNWERLRDRAWFEGQELFGT
jgi:uncharacterized protein YjaG (DUF416 family)